MTTLQNARLAHRDAHKTTIPAKSSPATFTPITLFAAIKAADIAYSNHESDLYFESTEVSRAILNQFPNQKSIATSFLSNTDHGKRWIDVPFAFLPWWESRADIALAQQSPL